ncbi:hypothetical protein ACSBOB_19970 [Mesorhizobium sp. ASY16-5R]|uniref:hypothetical protein n=1 Tax=Mesorhizobium sp. ASY16-5R TaxID=3445772 RepID=UPI003FA0BC6C
MVIEFYRKNATAPQDYDVYVDELGRITGQIITKNRVLRVVVHMIGNNWNTFHAEAILTILLPYKLATVAFYDFPDD